MAKDRLLKTYLYIFGMLNVFVLSFVIPIFFDVLMCQPRNIAVEMMTSGIYFSMGVIMIEIAGMGGEKGSDISSIQLDMDGLRK